MPRKSENPVSIWIDGCFDMVHFGHANAIRQAKAHGDRLVVGIHSDAEILAKKNSKPVFNEQERYKLVRAIKWVDEVVEDVPYNTSLEILNKHDCDFCMHGDDIVFDENGRDVYEEIKKQGRYKEFQRTEGVSTTDLLERILLAYRKIQETSRGSLVPYLDRTYSLAGLNTNEGAISEENASNNMPVYISPYTSGGIKYYLSTMRISQFSGGPVNLEPRPSDVIVYCPGTFDLFHIGHVEFLEKAAQLGDYLIAGLYGDRVSQLESSRIGTVMRLEERILSVLACRHVNNVIADVPYVISERFLDAYRIGLVVVGQHSKSDASDLMDPMQVAKNRGILRTIDSGSPVTTISVIERIVKNQLEITRRNREKQTREANLIAKQKNSPSSSAAS